MKHLWHNCHAATMQGGKYSIIEDAVLLTHAGRIEWIGPRAELPAIPYDVEVDLGGAWVTPGLIDCHTHLVFGGDRSREFEQRLEGVSYAEIAAQGAASPAPCAPPARPARTSCWKVPPAALASCCATA